MSFFLSDLRQQHNTTVRVLALRLILAYAISTLIVLFAQTASADAFNPGKIIDDSVFTNKSSMGVPEIQNFLNGKVPVCDTNGTQTSEYGGGTRAQWAQARYGQSTFICLKDINEGGRSAAQIIYDTAQRYQINPQVLLVLLQKEQGLVTDTWPLNIQYRSATGYGCPDTAPCDSQYYGLTNQLDWSGKMFRAIMNASPTWYTPYILGNNYIRYNPNASCGGSTVNIQNRSTQALYNYTPYQPNAAALAAPMGSTVNCGAYGNLNFFRYFTSWFGNTTQFTLPGCVQATNTSLSCVWQLTSPDGKNIYPIDHAQAQSLINSGAYRYNGFAFIGRNPYMPKSGNIPVYSITIGTEMFLTADQTEYTTLKGLGYADNGIAFYADPAGGNSGYPVYRLSSPTYGHAYTTDATTKAAYVSIGYNDEGVAFNALSPVRQETAPAAGQSLVYRFGSMPAGRHFWTTDVYERDTMIVSGYLYEGVAWRGSATPTSAPVYRLSTPVLRKHLFTKDENEKNVLSSQGWKYEGIAWYQNPSSSGLPIYRLYLKHNAENFLTTDANERSVLIRTGVGIDEGIAWYQ